MCAKITCTRKKEVSTLVGVALRCISYIYKPAPLSNLSLIYSSTLLSNHPDYSTNLPLTKAAPRTSTLIDPPTNRVSLQDAFSTKCQHQRTLLKPAQVAAAGALCNVHFTQTLPTCMHLPTTMCELHQTVCPCSCFHGAGNIATSYTIWFTVYL